MLNDKGVSTTKACDTFRYESYYSPTAGKVLVQWDYRDVHGELHSGVAVTVSAAKAKAAAFGYIDVDDRQLRTMAVAADAVVGMIFKGRAI